MMMTVRRRRWRWRGGRRRWWRRRRRRGGRRRWWRWLWRVRSPRRGGVERRFARQEYIAGLHVGTGGDLAGAEAPELIVRDRGGNSAIGVPYSGRRVGALIQDGVVGDREL